MSMRNERARTQAQQIRNAQTKVLPPNIMVWNYVMVRVSAERERNYQTKRKGLTHVIEAKSHLLLIVKNIHRSYRITTHAQCLIPYPISSQYQQA